MDKEKFRPAQTGSSASTSSNSKASEASTAKGGEQITVEQSAENAGGCAFCGTKEDNRKLLSMTDETPLGEYPLKGWFEC